MTLTKFPVETDKPTIEVTLEPGTHELELVVEDTAGLLSEPERVTITIVPANPVITGISVDRGVQGQFIRMVYITGQNLEGAESVTFSGTGVKAGIKPGGTATDLPITISIDNSAETGERTFTVTTRQGLTAESDNVTFEVVPRSVAVITGIQPAGGRQGAKDLEVHISGHNLQGASKASFSGTGVTAKIAPGGTPTDLPLSVNITANAILGPRTFKVETPQGTASSPADVTFTVETKLPVITGIRPPGGLQGVQNIDAHISGRNLQGATKVTFDGTGIKAAIKPGGTATDLPLSIDIKPDAKPVPRSFSVETPQGTAKSPRPVTFAVLSEPRPLPPEPRLVTPEPRLVTPEPRAVTPEPRAVTPEPRAVTPEPRAVTPEPRAVTPEPRAVTPEPRAVTPEPRAVTPEPRAVTPEPGPGGLIPRETPKKTKRVSKPRKKPEKK